MADIGKRNKIDLAFKKAIGLGVQAVNGKSFDGGPAPSIHAVIMGLVFDLTGDTRYRGSK